MKKNITINLCGRLFQIDEDAYNLLQNYLDSLRSHFGRQPEGEEIVNDIEARIAELFDELTTRGILAINIEEVKAIITRIGEPEQLAGEDEDRDNAREQASQHAFDDLHVQPASKRLFRNPNDKMVAGVLSGLAAYTNSDVLFWRLGTVLFTFFYGSGLLLYIIMAIIMPEAKTPEELLRMQGKPVNPQNLADAVIDPQPSRNHSNGLRGVFSVLLKVIFALFIGLFGFVAVILAIVFIGVISTVCFALFMPASGLIKLPFTLAGMGLTEVWANHPAVLILFVLSLLMVIFIPLYAIVHMVLSMTKKVKSMSLTQRVVWIVLWIVALCCLIPTSGMVAMLHNEYRWHPSEFLQRNVRVGITVYEENDTTTAGIEHTAGWKIDADSIENK